MGYFIGQASVEDTDDIIKLIKNEWYENHIFVKDKNFFNYVFKFNDEKINFIIAKDNEEIVGILGFLDYQKNKNINEKDIFTVMWKSHKNSMAGIKCFEYLLKCKYRSISSCGINLKTKAIYDFLGIETGKLNHWYILNKSFKQEDFNIAKIDNININDTLKNNKIIEIIDKDIIKLDIENINNNYIKKSKEYFIHHYIDNPYYNYKLYSIKRNNDINSIIVAREIKCRGNKCLRIIDFIGDEKDLVGIDFNIILNENNYEYIDIYEIGLSQDILKNDGFILKEQNDKNVIPNYFEPFEQKNVEIYYMTNCREKFFMFKGDGDQDRPSIARGENNEN